MEEATAGLTNTQEEGRLATYHLGKDQDGFTEEAHAGNSTYPITK